MKKHLTYSFLIFLLIITACSNDDEPVIKPVTTFEQDRFFIEPGESVTFTNTSQNGVSYAWDFGDNTASSNENPIHEYQELGEFIIRLTATSSTGERVATTSTVVVGQRWALGIRVETINFENANGAPWDDDDTGPDLLVGFAKASEADRIPLINFGNDYVPEDFPAGGIVPPELQILFTDEDWQFVMLDNEPPLNSPENAEEMVLFTLNPNNILSEKDYVLGSGVFEAESNGFRLLMLFELR